MAAFVHRFGSRACARGPRLGLRLSRPVPPRQYSASSFAQPLRRVFGEVLFRSRDEVDMPGPGELGAGAPRPSHGTIWSGSCSTARSPGWWSGSPTA